MVSLFPFYDYYGFFPKRNPDEKIRRLVRQLSVDLSDEFLWERLAREADRSNLVIKLSDPYLRSVEGGLYVTNTAHHHDSGALALQVFEQTMHESKLAWYLPVLEIYNYLDAPIEISLVRPQDVR